MIFRWLKPLSPRTLIGRTALILLVPILSIQVVVSYVFIQRLYERVTESMTQSILPSVELVLDTVEAAPDQAAALARGQDLGTALGITLRFDDAEELVAGRGFIDLSGRVVERELRAALPGMGAVDLASNPRRVRFVIETSHGPAVIGFARNRVSASNPHQLLVLMVAVAGVATLISFLFLKNQVRPIRRLAQAAAAFGKGRTVPYRPGGATEVRLAGAAFLEMRNRIERHIEQRTLLLSGVSHDLKTPVTRLKLGLSMMEETDEVRDLLRDVDDMQRMLDTFLGFARIDATEATELSDPVEMAREAIDRVPSHGKPVDLKVHALGNAPVLVPLRPMAVARALDNLIGNAVRYGTRVRVTVDIFENSVRFRIEDDGPGIPAESREEALKPFARLDASRNQNRGGSVGLGLSIVRDIARQHGGSFRLEESDTLGGLRADLVLVR